MIPIGIKLMGCCQPIIIAAGVNIKKDIKIPFNIPLSFRFDVAIMKPAITHRENADRFASHVKF